MQFSVFAIALAAAMSSRCMVAGRHRHPFPPPPPPPCRRYHEETNPGWPSRILLRLTSEPPNRGRVYRHTFTSTVYFSEA